MAYTEADTRVKLSGIDKGVLKDAFAFGWADICEGYFGLQREIYR